MPKPKWHELLPKPPLPMFSWAMNLRLISAVTRRKLPATASSLARRADLLKRIDARGHAYPQVLAYLFAALKDQKRFTVADKLAKEVKAQNRKHQLITEHQFPEHLYTLDSQQLANELEQHTFRDPEDFELSDDN